ncbi:hypothetical protein [Streptomyces sp. NRRL S-1868]|uniref:hypothetical protein n=1 Tax=Streptomyces sp. NRRL S-1868 TaxID=1463892 RepID=UPI00131CEC80|nr:hypothetical protein [Streptomyces sp. NRRL S-1868]
MFDVLWEGPIGAGEAVWSWVAAHAVELLVLGVLAGVAGAAVRLAWRRRVCAGLRNRCRVELVPSSSFDPGRAEIEWFAERLAAASAAAGALPRRASAVRVWMGGDAEGLLAYRVEGPEHAASVLRTSAYAEVEAARTPVRPPRIRFEGAAPVRRGPGAGEA